MAFEFSYELARSWPTLAWLAQCEPGSDSIRIVHGPGVECRAGWFCEAVWDADFAAGDFDRTDLIFGSGGRCRDEMVTLVAAGSTVDRLQFATRGNATLVSNSLACLLEGIDARLDPAFRGYDELFEQINFGIDQPFPDLPTAGGRIGFTYFHNLVWDGTQLRQAPKPAPSRDFGSFEKYTGFLRGAMQRMGENMSSPERMRPLDWLGTISRGYDSATCVELARDAGLRRVMTHDESRPGIPDDGVAIAEVLKVDCVMVNRLAWRSQPSPPEPLFLAADAQGKELMVAGIPLDLDGMVMLTGQGGDRAWGMEFKSRPLPGASGGQSAMHSLARRWHSGLSLTEQRLHAGYIQLPLPFMGMRQLADLLELSNSPEMAAWDIGGHYSRPICRRILEEAGVRRDMFGTVKTGASIRFLRGEDEWSPDGKRSFFRWLRRHGPEHGMLRRALLEVRSLLLALETALALGRIGPGPVKKRFRRLAFRLARRIKASGLNDLAFVWAIETVRKSYRRKDG